MVRELKQETIEKRIKSFIQRYKFLKNEKYYKTNKVSVAAYDSWAARGQAGGCSTCNCEHYIYSLYNKRATGKEKWWHSNKFGSFCRRCYQELERQCNYKFEKY